MVMANEKVLIEDNILQHNPTAPIMVIAYTLPFDDDRYNPMPRGVVVGTNNYGVGGDDPQLDGAEMLVAAFGGALPPVMWDGLGSLYATAGTAGWSLNLTEQGKGLAAAQPSPLNVPEAETAFDRSGIGAPPELDDRIG
jgi:hypothetical protein